MIATNWQNCKNILCIRPDNMGDLIMTGPALRALKNSFGARITVLTSSVAAAVAACMPEVDDVLVCDLPWVKMPGNTDPGVFANTVSRISAMQFDAAIVFTVYSQNPLPTIMLAYLAGVPRRLGYCRENPYQLLTDWVPDMEPYTVIKHQVIRDLDLVAAVGAYTSNDGLMLSVGPADEKNVTGIMQANGIYLSEKWLVLHPGVSENKRQYPVEKWIVAGRKLVNEGYQILITGTQNETELTGTIQAGIGAGSFNAGGLFDLKKFIAVIKMAPAVVSVNTGTVHIAAAVKTGVVVLYALTNPQHTPWMVACKVLPFQVPPGTHSKNEVIKYVNETYFPLPVPLPDEHDICNAVADLLNSGNDQVNRSIVQLHGQIPSDNPAVQAS